MIASDLTNPWVIARSWTFDPLVLAGVGVSSWMYVRAAGRLRPSFWPRSRTRAWIAGNAVLVLALMSPLDVYSGLLLSVHMVQHLLLTMVAPPLLLLGAPITLALRSARPSDRLVMVKVLRSHTVRFLSGPLLGWFAFLGVLWISHLPAFYIATLEHLWLHAAEHLAYLITALMFWRPMVGRDPSPARLSHPARLLWLFLAMPQMTFLGLAIYGADRVLYTPYVATSPLLGTTALSDQHLAGAIMWASAMLFMVPAMAVVHWDRMKAEEREAARMYARLDRAAAASSGGG